MFTNKYNRIIWVVLILLSVTIGGSWAKDKVQASNSFQNSSPAEVTIPYSGYLADGEGNPITDGAYDFTFAVYNTDVGGTPLWTDNFEDVVVRDGAFDTALVISGEGVDQNSLWLEISVRGPKETEYSLLSPRQPLRMIAPTEVESTLNGAPCPHDHVGEIWSGNVAWSNGAFKVLNYANGPSIWGWNGGNGNGIRGYATGTGIGVYGESINSGGVVGRSTSGNGVESYSTNGKGLFANSTNDDSIYVSGAGKNGIYVASSGDNGVYVYSSGWSGVSVRSATAAGMWVNSAGQDGVLISTAGWDGVHVVGPVGGSYYGSGKKGAEDFLVLNTGEVRSKVGFSTPSGGFAQILPVDGVSSNYEAGDVVVMGGAGDMKVTLSSEQSSPTVIGVYANSPGFIGGQAVSPSDSSTGIAVTMMGIVPVKVSAENGPIQPGDLLVTSSTPGHAMHSDNPLPGTILGKALEPLGKGTSVILVLLMLQ